MHQLKLLLLIILIFSCQSLRNKKTQSQNNFIETESFGIRTKPVLNREYLIYLAWNIDIYGLSYPEKIKSILPKEGIGEINFNDELTNGFLDQSEGILKDYILNSKYLNYPLLGLTTNQVLDLAKWLNDRYNENQLINEGFYNFNPEQKDEDCFVFESYLVGQYEGSVRKVISHVSIPPKEWGLNIFKSNFRLPTNSELKALGDQQKNIKKFKKYSFGKKDFLWRWHKHFSQEYNWSRVKFYKKLIDNNSIASDYNFSSKIFELKILEEKEVYQNDFKYLKTDYSEKYPYPEKNRYGQMDFVIVGNDKNSRPIIQDRIKVKSDNSESNKIYLIAYFNTIDSKVLVE